MVTPISAEKHEMLDKLYSPTNIEILKSTCVHYCETTDLCKACCFYSINNQYEQLGGNTCGFWQDVFGFDLQKQLISYMDRGIKLGKHFMDVWHARKIAIPMMVPQKALIKHSPDVKPGVARVLQQDHLTVKDVGVHKSTRAGEDQIPRFISIVEVERGQ